MRRECQPKVTTIKESNDLNNLDIIKLFGKLIGHENELKQLVASEVNAKKKDMVKEYKWDLIESFIVKDKESRGRL